MAATAVLMGTLGSSQRGQEESSFCLSTDKARLNNFIYVMAHDASM